MKKILLIPIILIILFTSCKKKVYLTDEQKALLLYDVGDKFTLVKNETDTLNFEVTKKEFDFGDDYNGLFKTGTYYEGGHLEFYTKNIKSYVRVSSYYNDEDKNNYGISFLLNTSNYMGFQQPKKISNYILNDKSYNNSYILIGNFHPDTMYISTDV